ncbi:tetratricopeptide repeat protein [[Actinomadura] parvosata]|uniref:tetratricopeptide repeat protein n=1 Tax=[Actinomadura] parvosata TaxID=1955412 RepID=UPI00406C5C8D
MTTTVKEPRMTADPTLARIGQGVELHHHQGRPDAARELFQRIWDDIGGERGDPLHVCVLAHSMADVQDDMRQELEWDLRALSAAGRVTDEQVAQAGVPLSVAGLYPSLHLNLSECYRKLGDLERAREHFQQARAGIGALADDAYGQLIKDGLERVAEHLGETVTPSGGGSGTAGNGPEEAGARS